MPILEIVWDAQTISRIDIWAKRKQVVFTFSIKMNLFFQKESLDMTLGKVLGITVIIILVLMGIAVVIKDKPVSESPSSNQQEKELIEISLEETPFSPVPAKPQEKQIPILKKEESTEASLTAKNVDRIQELFSTTGPKLPIVETISYKSRVLWQKGRPAWLSDYASHYKTSRHFIARSLNGKPDYLKQEIAEGDKFNVLKPDKLIEFHLVIDVSQCKMGFYYFDLDTHEKVLLKTYAVSLGRPDNSKASGLLTPLGKYSLGNRIAIYKPSVIGYYKGQKIEMIRVFGTRWIPFDKEISHCTAPAKGLGLHAVPWIKNAQGCWEQDLSSLGKYESDGCVRMSSEDMEEVFAIIITRPSYIELVKELEWTY